MPDIQEESVKKEEAPQEEEENKVLADPSEQREMVFNLKQLLSEYKKGDKTQDAVVTEILGEMKASQEKNKKTMFSTADNFNLKLLQGLPEDLQDDACRRLGIKKDSEILTDSNYDIQRKLGKIIGEYEEEDTKPGLAQAP